MPLSKYKIVENIIPEAFPKKTLDWLFENDPRCEALTLIPNLKEVIYDFYNNSWALKLFLNSFDRHDSIFVNGIIATQKYTSPEYPIRVVITDEPLYVIFDNVIEAELDEDDIEIKNKCTEYIVPFNEYQIYDARERKTNFNSLISFFHKVYKK